MELEVLREEVRARRDLPAPSERRALRERAGLSLAALAEALGTAPGVISLYERGLRYPRRDRLVEYVRLLDALREELDERTDAAA